MPAGDGDNHKLDEDDDDDEEFTVSTNFEVDEDQHDGDDTITGADFPKIDERQNERQHHNS